MARKIEIVDGMQKVLGCRVAQDLDILNIDLPDYVDAAGGMLSKAERRMLTGLIRDRYRGAGAIIDGGSFFGSSLVSEAQALTDNPGRDTMDFSAMPAGKPIHGYELGFLPAPKNPKADRAREFNGVKYMMGDSFVPILEDNVRPYADLIELHIGDLCTFTWPEAPIEIAFIDVCKTMALNAHVSRQFYPRLIPGASWLINQDFFFDRLPWIKVTMGYLADYFEWKGQVFTSSIYRNVKAVPQDVADYDPFTQGSLEECLAYHDRTPVAGAEPRWQYYMRLSRAYLMALKGTAEQALAEIDAAEAEFAAILDDTDNARGNAFRLKRARRQISHGKLLEMS